MSPSPINSSTTHAQRPRLTSISILGVLSIPLSVTLLVTLSGCDRRFEESVNIFYRQIGICNTYDTVDGPVTTRPNETFVVFKIEAVDNLTSKTFNFEPSLLYVDQSTPNQKTGTIGPWDPRFASDDRRFAKSLGLPGAVPATIPKERKVELNTFLAVLVSTIKPSGSRDDNPRSYELRYDSAEHEQAQTVEPDGFLYIKTNAIGTTWSPKANCKAIELK